jgi:electron transport complex protein RnfG
MEAESRPRLVAAATLAALAAVAALAISVLDTFTGTRIAESRERAAMAVVAEALPVDHDNDLLADRITVSDPLRPPLRGPVTVYRARRGGQPAGVVLVPVRARGYSGTIDLAIGIRNDGTLAGVRVVRENETPGLGDRVHQDRSPWLDRFRGRSLEDPPAAEWAPGSAGGAFDQLSGATITSRGVVSAVHAALEYHAAAREDLYR